MSSRNYKQLYIDNSFKKSNTQRTYVVNKLKKNNNRIQNLKQRINLLFNTPETYLKLPEESSFNFRIGQVLKIPKFHKLHSESNKNLSRSQCYLMKEQQRKMTRLKSNLSLNIISPRPSRSCSRVTSANLNIIMNINDSTPFPEDKRRKKSVLYQPIYTNVMTDINNLFNQSRNRIAKNKIQHLDNSNALFNNLPKLMKPYIKIPLRRQEKALKNSEKYNEMINNIENKISKSFKMKRKANKKNNLYNESNKFDSYFNNSSNLMKKSGSEYRMKIDKINSYEKKKKPHLVLDNHIQNWEMSLRRPKNDFGERREYLNVRTDNNPYWIVKREHNPLEEEKIIYRQAYNNNTFKGISNIKNSVNNSNYKSYSKLLDLNSNESYSNDMNMNNVNNVNNLEIKGRKLIDVEERLKNKMKGKLKLINFKYDRESLKNIIFKKNYFINKHIIKNK